MESNSPTTTIETTSDITLGSPYNVILFNDQNHSMDEVLNQIVKAIHCDPTRAFQIMMEAHNKGRAIAYSGGLERCELVESVLSEIRLGTKIEQA